MSTQVASWYVVGEGKQPVGPFAAEELAKSLRAGHVDSGDLCWREGLAEWLPLSRLEPFASTIRLERRRMRRRVAVCAVAGALAGLVIGGAGLAGYVYWDESSSLAEARTLAAQERYDEAIDNLRSLRDNTYFCRSEADYLLGSALVRKYATCQPGPPPSDGLEETQGLFRALFDSSARWRQRAKSDLADLMAGIPRDAPDALARSTALAGLLGELGLPELAVLPPWLEQEKRFADSCKKGNEAFEAGDYGNALSWLGDAMKIKPDDEPTKRRLHEARAAMVSDKLSKAERMVSDGECEKARVVIADVEKLEPGNERAKLLRARADNLDNFRELKRTGIEAVQAKDYEKAIPLLREARKIKPGDEEINRALDDATAAFVTQLLSDAERMVSQGEYGKAEAVLAKVDDADPRNEDAKRLRSKINATKTFGQLKSDAIEAIEKGEYERACSLLSAALKIKPDDEEVKTLAQKAKKALMQEQLSAVQRLMSDGKYNEAQKSLTEALQFDPGNAAALDLAKKIDELNRNPETVDLTGVWHSEGTRNEFHFTVEGSRVKVEAVPGSDLTLSGGKKVDTISGTWQREGKRLDGDFRVVFPDGQAITLEVPATVTSPTTLRVRWKEAKWDAERKKWIGWGYGDWTRE